MKKLFLGYFLLVISYQAFSQTLIDVGDKHPLLRGDNRVRIAVLDNNNSLYLGGNITFVNDAVSPPLVRIMQDGTPDSTFNYDGFYSNGWENSIAVSDDKVVMLNGSLYVSRSDGSGILRVLPDGKTDNSFSFSGIDYLVISFIEYRDSLLVIGEEGKVQLYAEDGNYRVIETGLSTDNYLLGLHKLATDKVLFLIQNKSTGTFSYALFKNDIVKDETFIPFKVDQPGSVKRISLLPNGVIFLAGKKVQVNDTPGNGIFYIDNTGAIDTNSPHNADISFVDFYNTGIETAMPLNDGKIMVIGRSDPGNYRNLSLGRLVSNGTRDDTFVIRNFLAPDLETRSPKLFADAANDVYLIYGQVSYDGQVSYGINKITTDGENIPAYSVRLAGKAWVNQFTPYDTDKFLLSGRFNMSNYSMTPHIAAFSLNNYTYPWLDTVDVTTEDIMGLAKVLSNGDIFMGFYDQNNSGIFKVYKQDGTDINLGLNQASATQATRPVYNIHESTNFIYATGIFGYAVSGVNKNGIIKMNKDYSIVTGYTPAIEVSNKEVIFSYLTNDDKLIIQYTDYINNINNIIRLLPDGSKDNTFNDLVIGNMDWGGSKTFVVGDSLLMLYKNDYNNPQTLKVYDLDGNPLDDNFVTFSADGVINKILPLSDTTVLIAGRFSTINNLQKKNVALLNLNGIVYDDLGLTVNAGEISEMTIHNDTLYILGPEGINNYGGAGFYAFTMSTRAIDMDTITVTEAGGIKFDWKDDNSLRSYKFYRTAPGGSKTLITTLEKGVNSYIDDNVEVNTNYLYNIVTTNFLGSAEVTLNYEIIKPNAPGNLNVQYNSGIVTLSWTDNSTNETGFQVYVKTDNGPYELIKTLPADTTTYSYALAIDHIYSFKIVAISANYYSDPSNTAAIDLLLPDAPVNLSFTYDVSTQITTLTWDAADGRADNFTVFESVNASDYVALDTLASTTFSYARSTPEPKTYYYYVQASNAIGSSTPSQIVEVNVAILGFDPEGLTYSVYPNPSTGKLKIDLQDIKADFFTLTNIQGKVIREVSLKNKQNIELYNLPKGILMLRMYDNNGKVKTWKVVVK